MEVRLLERPLNCLVGLLLNGKHVCLRAEGGHQNEHEEDGPDNRSYPSPPGGIEFHRFFTPSRFLTPHAGTTWTWIEIKAPPDVLTTTV